MNDTETEVEIPDFDIRRDHRSKMGDKRISPDGKIWICHGSLQSSNGIHVIWVQHQDSKYYPDSEILKNHANFVDAIKNTLRGFIAADVSENEILETIATFARSYRREIAGTTEEDLTFKMALDRLTSIYDRHIKALRDCVTDPDHANPQSKEIEQIKEKIKQAADDIFTLKDIWKSARIDK